MSAPVYVSAFGEMKSLSDWSRDARCVVPYQSLVQRIQQLGYAAERAITSPKKQGGFRIKRGRKSKYTPELSPRKGVRV